jgi:hypothetical protein
MKVTSATLMVNVENKIEVGPLKLTAIHQICLYENKDGSIAHDVDLMDHTDVTYMGVPIDDDYKNWRKFVDFHKEMGINFDKLINEESEKVLIEQNIKRMVSDLVSQSIVNVIKGGI